MKDINFIKSYIINFSKLIKFNKNTSLSITNVKKILLDTKKRNKKILIFGNGGSAAIASHFSVDITKFTKIRCVNFNESDLITCFANDYGYKEWVRKAVEFYGDEGDVGIFISSSGKSPNIINGCLAAKKKRFKSIITLSGFKKNNPLRKKGNINFWVNSTTYNFIENTHQFWLLLIIDLIINDKN
jgi:D-sedoheptulose 7-phosphate isomerase